MVKVNGEIKDIAGENLEVYLKSANYNLLCIAVERNMEIVPKSQYSTTIIQDDDQIEIVNFVGGG